MASDVGLNKWRAEEIIRPHRAINLRISSRIEALHVAALYDKRRNAEKSLLKLLSLYAVL